MTTVAPMPPGTIPNAGIAERVHEEPDVEALAGVEAAEAPVSELPDVDREYREKAKRDALPKIAPPAVQRYGGAVAPGAPYAARPAQGQARGPRPRAGVHRPMPRRRVARRGGWASRPQGMNCRRCRRGG